MIKDGEGTVLQRFDYYPFGSESRVWTAGTNTPQSALRYRFGGKEIAGQKVNTTTGAPAAAAGSPYLDFGARVYDPRTAAWLSQDPLSEKYYSISPYAYCAGNPVNLVDSNGASLTSYYDEYGFLLYRTDDGLDTVIIIQESNVSVLENRLYDMSLSGTIDNSIDNIEQLHVLGKTPTEYTHVMTGGMDNNWVIGFNSTYPEAYHEKRHVLGLKNIWFVLLGALANGSDDPIGAAPMINLASGREQGIIEGNADRKAGKINRLSPESSLRDNLPIIHFKKYEK